jgi:hypothetical protein
VAPSLVVAAWLLGPLPSGLRELGEVPAAVPVQRGPAAQPTPSDPHIMQGRGLDPLLEGLFAELEEHSAAALVLGAHDMHAL